LNGGKSWRLSLWQVRYWGVKFFDVILQNLLLACPQFGILFLCALRLNPCFQPPVSTHFKQ
jgi:hypothetical protein